MKIYNTITRTKEQLVPITPGKVAIYVCGVTSYDYCHLGHGRTFVSFDIIVRYLKFAGYNVTYVRNITDIDDKIIHRAQQNNESCQQLTERFIRYMHKDAMALNLLPPDNEPKATEHIPQMIAIILQLLANKHAYQANNGDIIFSITTFDKYGELSRQDLSKLQQGARVTVDHSKKNAMDFVLWKLAKPGEPAWDSPWGAGRPGWHIECSAMSHQYLGKAIDIHGGGADLLFPHHENELAQSCCAQHNLYVNLWMHSGLVQINKEKMSKSLNNFITIESILKNHNGETVRYFLLSSHYRSQLNYTKNSLTQANAALVRLYTALRSVNILPLDNTGKKYTDLFIASMNDDFNTPEALSVLFELTKEINKASKLQTKYAGKLAGILKKLANILGLLYQNPEEFLQGTKNDNSLQNIEQLITARQIARNNKNWVEADAIRDKLKSIGIKLEESKNGVNWRRI